MTTRTRAELVKSTLESLGVLAAGQVPEIEDTKRVDDELPSIIATLAADEVVYIQDIDNIDEALFSPLADVCAWNVRQKFGISGTDLADLEKAFESGKVTMRRIMRGRPTYAPLRTDFI